MRLTAITHDLELLGDPVSEYKQVTKLLRLVPRMYRQMAASIESLLDLKTMPLEELVGRLIVCEERDEEDEPAQSGGRLLLTEEEWAERYRQREHGGSSSSTPGEKSSPGEKNSPGEKKNKPRERKKGACHYCGIEGHYAKECRKAKRDREKLQELNLTQAEPEEEEAPVALMLAAVSTIDVEPKHVIDNPSEQRVFLNEERIVPVPTDDDRWYLDSGASNHMTGNEHLLSMIDYSVRGMVRFGDGSRVEITGRGAVLFTCRNGEHRVLNDVYLIPRLRTSIVSLGQLDEIAYKTVIEHGAMCVYDQHRQLLAKAPRMGNRLYSVALQKAVPVCLLAKAGDVAWLWHARYGHLHFRALYELGAKEMVDGMPSISRVEQVCEGCVIGKQHRTPFPRASPYRAQRGLELVHGDLCGPITPATLGGNKYFLLIVDDHSRYMWVETIRTKDEALRFIKRIRALAENESGLRLCAIRTDRGGEFNSGDVTAFCDEHGIKHFTTAPYSPQQNGVVERRNQTVVEMARSLLKSMAMPAVFWGEAVRTAVHILNRAPTRSLAGKTPYEAWRGRKPNVSYLRTFGCVVHVKNVGPGITKLSDRSTPMVFIGYEEGSKAYRVYDPAAKKLRITRDVVFEETRPWPWVANGGIDLKEQFTVVYNLEPSTSNCSRSKCTSCSG
jgi:transposase InsO family protein